METLNELPLNFGSEHTVNGWNRGIEVLLQPMVFSRQCGPFTQMPFPAI
jgi:hypothetical protein